MATPTTELNKLLGIRKQKSSAGPDPLLTPLPGLPAASTSGNGSILNVAKDLPKFAVSGAQSLVADTGALVEGAGAFLRDPTLEARGRTFREGQEGQIAARIETLSPESQRVSEAGVTDIGLFGGDVPTGQFLLGKTAELLPGTLAGGAIGKGIQLATKGAIGVGAGSAIGESLVSAPSGAAQQSRDIDNTTTEKLLQDSAQFRAAFEKNANLSPEEQDAAARSELKGLALPTGALASALSVAAGSALANRAFKGTAGGVFEEAADTAQGVIAGTLGGARREAIQEVAQSTLESIAADTVTATFVDPAAAKIDNLIKNAALSALEGAVLGGTVGGVIGSVQGKLNKDATKKVEKAQAIVKAKEVAAKKAASEAPAAEGEPAAEKPKQSKSSTDIVKNILNIPKEKSKVDVDAVRATLQTFSEQTPEVLNEVAAQLGISKNITPQEKLEAVNLVIDSQAGATPDTRNLSVEQRAAREASAVDVNRAPAGLPEGQVSNTDRAKAEVKAVEPKLSKSSRTELEAIAADPDPIARALAFDNVVNRIGESGKEDGSSIRSLAAAEILRDNAQAEVLANEGVTQDEIVPGKIDENLGEDLTAKVDPEAVAFDDTPDQTITAAAGEIPATTGKPAVVVTENLNAATSVPQDGIPTANAADIEAASNTVKVEGSAELQAVTAANAAVQEQVQAVETQAIAQAQAPQTFPDIVLDGKTITTSGLNKLPRSKLNRIFEEQFGGQRGAETNKQLISKIREVRSTGVLPVDAPTTVTDVGTGQVVALPEVGAVPVQQTIPEPAAGRTVAVGKLGDVEVTQASLSARPVSDLVKVGKKLGVKRNNQPKADFVVALSVADIPADTQAPTAPTTVPVFTPVPAESTPNVSSEEIDAIVNNVFPVAESPDIVENPIRTENELVNKELAPRQVLTTFDDVPITVDRINTGGPTSQDLVDAKSESIFGDDLEDISVVLGVDLEGKFKKLETAKKALIKALESDTGSTVRSESSIEKAKQKEENMTAAADALITNARPDQLVQLQEHFTKRPDLVERQLRQEAARPDANLDNALAEINSAIETANTIPAEDAQAVLEDYNSLTDQQAEEISVESLSDETAPTIRASFADTTGGKGMSSADVRSALSKFTGQGFVRLTVVENVEQLPDGAKRFVKSTGVEGTVRGLYVPSTDISSDKIFIVARNINSQEEAIFVALHEAVHRGLTKTFGSNMRKVLNTIHDGNTVVRDRVAARIKDDPKTPKAVHIEEVLADMAKDGSARSLNLWNKIVDFISKWLKGKGVTVPISDSIVEQIVAGAQRVGMNADPGTMGQDRKAQTASAEFRQFFNGSQIVNDDGSPKIMFHGTGADNLTEFRRGVSEAVFVTPAPRFASRFAKSSTGDSPNIVPTYVSAKNPFDFDNTEHVVQLTGQLIRGLSLAPGSLEAQRAIGRIRSDMDKIVANTESNWLVLEDPTVQNAIKALGHDGFFVKEDSTKNLGVYQPEQLKSAIGNRGTFSRVNPDIRASVKPADGPVHTFDRVDGVLNSIVKLVQSTSPKITGMLHRKNLYFSTGAHIAEFYGRILGATMGPQVKASIDLIESANGKASAITNKLNKDTSLLEKQMIMKGDVKAEAVLNELLGESSRLGIWPNRPFAEQQWLTLNQTNADISRARKLHANLSKTYNKNPDVAAVYDKVTAHNARDFDLGYAAILKSLAFSFNAPEAIWRGLDPNLKLSVDQNISDSFDTGVQLAELWMKTQAGFEGVEALRSMQEFRASRSQGPYVHLGRFGSHFIRFKVAATPEAQAAVSAAMEATGQSEASFISENADNVFLRFEDEQQWRQNVAVLEELRTQGHLETLTPGKLEENSAELDSGSLTFVTKLLGRVDDDLALSTDEEQRTLTKEVIRRLVVEMMPEVTGSKHLARRKNRLGYDLDIRRSFVKRSAANAFMVAHNSTRPEVMTGFNGLRKEIRDFNKPGADLKTVDLATDVLNHLKERMNNNMSPIHAPTTDALSALGYTMFLASNPPHILANMMQPLQTTLPVLGGRFGFTKAAGAMFRALKVASKIIKDTVQDGYKSGGWSGILDAHIVIDRADLTPGQKAAMNAFIDSGRLEFTQAHGLGRISQGQSERLNTTSKALGAASHFSEAVNRIISGLAAYDLEVERAKGNGQSGADAQDTATQFGLSSIAKTQFLYDTENKALAFSKRGVLGSVTPLATGFQQFNMQFLQLVSDMTLQAFQGSPQEQVEAKKTMRGMLAVTTTLAGVVGLPFMALVAAVYDRLGDDDDPNDLRADMTRFFSDMMGADAANILMHGAADRVLGGTISTRVSLADVVPFSRFLEDRREIKDKLDSGALGLLGPSVGAGTNLVLGASKIVDGDIMKGMIMMLPAGLQGPLKGFDLAQNGFTTGRGDKLPISVSTWDNVIQTLNFNPTIKSQLQRNVSSEFVRESLLNKRKSQLTRDFIEALEDGNSDDQQRVGREITEFFVQNPDRGAFDIGAAIKGRETKLAVARITGTGVGTSAGRAASLINRLQGITPELLKRGLDNGL